MAKQQIGKASAEVADFSGEKDGKTSVKVDYAFDYDELETMAEVNEKFSHEQLLAMANARLKGTANSTARAKAVAPYAQDPNSPAAARERLVKDLMLARGWSEEKARAVLSSI